MMIAVETKVAEVNNRMSLTAGPAGGGCGDCREEAEDAKHV